MGGTLQSGLAWPSQGWTSPARDLRLNRSSRSSSRRSKIEITSKMTPGVKERSEWEEAVRIQVAGTRKCWCCVTKGAAGTHPREAFPVVMVEVDGDGVVDGTRESHFAGLSRAAHEGADSLTYVLTSSVPT